ncbi:hypothetical protein QQF64_013195, partial [Cirrhinus molitorella]
MCTATDHKNHNTVPIEEEIEEKRTQLIKTQKDMQQMIQERLKKIQDIKHSAEVRKRNTEKEKAVHVELFTDLILSIERCQTELLEMMEEQQKAAEKQEQELIEDLEQEITELKMRNTELEQLSHTEDHLHLLQIYSSFCSPTNTRNWPEISMKTHESLENLRRALTQLQDTLDEKLTQSELKWMRQYAVDVILDPNTAHPRLILSDDGKQVRDGNIYQKVLHKLERFDTCVNVLGKEGFSSGRFYFEVQVKEKTEWDLGVVRESINRKGKITASPDTGYWSVVLRYGNEYKAGAGPSVPLSLRVKPQRVGVFVDYEEGLVCFYDVESSSHIYSYTGQSFNGKLYPYLQRALNDPIMSSSSGPLTEELQCSICLDVFTDPVSTPCGHNFCKTCLNKCWDNSQTCSCPYCQETFSQRPDLKINTTLREIVDHYKKKNPEEKTEVLCDFCEERKLKALKSCLVCQSSYCETHLQPHFKVAGLKKHKLMEPVSNLEEYICQKHERPLELFCRDDQTCVCLMCTVTDHKNHNTVPLEEEIEEKKTQLMKTQKDVQQLIRDRTKKIQDIKHSAQIRKRIYTELLEMMEEQQKAAEKQEQELIEELEQEITELKMRNTELEQLSHTEDHLHLLQIYSSLCSPTNTRNWPEISMKTNTSLRRALTQLQDRLHEKLIQTVSTELKWVQQCAVDVILDADTAHPNLILLRRERLKEEEDVAECWFDSVGDRGHADMCTPLHAFR